MTNIKHIFFDLDHTLWDFEKNSALAFEQIFAKYGFRLSFSDFIQTYVPINHSYWELFNYGQITKPVLRYGRLKDTFDALNYEIENELIHQVAEDYLDFLPNYNHLIEDTLTVLKYLKSKYQLHIITNGFEHIQRKKIEASNISAFFDVIVTSDSIGLKKPDSKVFEFALQQANASAISSVMIGDNYKADVLGAHQVGIKPVFFKNGLTFDSDEFLSIDRLIELKQYL